MDRSAVTSVALLGAGLLADAERIASHAVDQVAGAASTERPGDRLSVHGALVLLLAVIAARRGDGPPLERTLARPGSSPTSSVVTVIGCGRPLARPTWPFTSCQASLAAHPAFHRNLRTLSDWGVTVLANESIRYGAAAGQSFNWEPVTRAVMAARDLDER